MVKNNVLILCAGKSERMGLPKALLSFSETDTFLSHLIKSYDGISDKIIIVTSNSLFEFIQMNKRKYFYSEVIYIVNEYPEKGKIYSIQKGLEHIDANYTFIQNIDNPFVTKELLRSMLSLMTEKSYVVPSYRSKNGHPLLIDKYISNEIRKKSTENFNIQFLLKKFKKIDCPSTEPKVLLNINTPKEYYLAFNKEMYVDEWI